jgi:UDP-3-O-[3-hydroxymyristoyl] N-acetylglucosamine deacetylase
LDGYQSTLQRAVRFSGVGLHSGRVVNIEIAPAKANTGIRFLRTDLAPSVIIPADVASIRSTELSTTLGFGVATVATVEHLMAAFAGLGVDNALVRIDGPEVPILDGSSAPFVDKIMTVGIAKVEGSRKLFLVKRPFEVRDGNRVMRVEPADRPRFECTIDYASAAIGRQHLDFAFSRSSFLDLCESRTFCHEKEVNAMRAAGLALGGSLDNAIVVDDHAVINAEGLRVADEFVRHKLLDCIGDLALLGAPLVGRITLERNGHGLHARFMRELLASKADLLTVVEIGSFNRRPAMPDSLQAISVAAAIYG